MSRLSETKKMMHTQRLINSQIFFFEFPVGQTKIKERKKIDPLIEVVDGYIFNMMDGVLGYQGVNYNVGQVSLKILHAIITEKGKVISEPDIFEQVWGRKKYKQGDVSKVISRIKIKMGDIIFSHYGKGYSLNLDYGRRIETKVA